MKSVRPIKRVGTLLNMTEWFKMITEWAFLCFTFIMAKINQDTLSLSLSLISLSNRAAHASREKYGVIHKVPPLLSGLQRRERSGGWIKPFQMFGPFNWNLPRGDKRAWRLSGECRCSAPAGGTAPSTSLNRRWWIVRHQRSCRAAGACHCPREGEKMSAALTWCQRYRWGCGPVLINYL